MRRFIIGGLAGGKPDPALVKAVARAHVWFEELTSGRASCILAIAERERVSDRFVSITLDLAFLAPSLIEAIVEGRQPADMTAKRLVVGEAIPLRRSGVLGPSTGDPAANER